jgi:serine/threonine protein kinase/tetratricopeptide (TPR) repeat protein
MGNAGEKDDRRPSLQSETSRERVSSDEIVRKNVARTPHASVESSGGTVDLAPLLSDAVTDPEPDEDSAPPSIPSAASIGLDDTLLGEPPARTAVQVIPGQLIAQRYEMQSVLGEGGMGIVYRCRDQATGQLVALKRVIVPEGGLEREYVMWFYKEARALAALDHPGIVRARDFGQLVDGSPYLVMDLVPGVSLHDLAQVRLSFAVIWSIVDQVLSALAHAHARGIVHGDLKPSNVLIEPVAGDAPRVRILDFGLAWLKQDRHDERLDGSKAPEVMPHAGAGTPGYMAPEQIQHEMHHVCGATDLYALGCILYKLLSGRTPFVGNSKELLRVHAFEEPPRPKLLVDAPDGAVDFVAQLLAKRPWLRFEFAAGARAEWAAWRPSLAVGASEWALPRLTHNAEQPPPTRPIVARPHNPALDPAPERAPGLLNMRPSPLVGRHSVRKVLREICDEVIDGVGTPHRLVLLMGAAGVGKSRIAEWLCEVVHEEGTMVPLRARYRSIRGPLDGMAGAISQYYNFERIDRDVIESSLLDRWNVQPNDKNGRAWVAGAAEWMRPVGPLSDRPLGPSGIRFTLDTLETRRMVARYTVRRVTAGRPTLFWLDDLHHAGQTTFEGLLKMHREEADHRYVMVVTVRSEDVRLGTPAAERLRYLREHMAGVVIEVPPLTPDETRSLLRASLPLDAPAVEEAARRSRGNPLFALQQLHAWALGGSMRFARGVYCVEPKVLEVRPQTTTELWDSRVAAMPEAHRLAATAAAALGADVRHEVLHELLGTLGLPAEPAIVSLQQAEVLIPRGAGRYSWPHALLQEHLFERLEERSDRQFIYRAAAFALAKHPLARTRRIVRLRVVNLLHSGEPSAAARLLFKFIQDNWSGAREPLATLSDLELLEGLKGRWLALKHRWKAEALRHVGRTDEAKLFADMALEAFTELSDRENAAHCLRLLGNTASERGNSVEGLEFVHRGYLIFQELKDVHGMAQCEAVAGEIEYLLGNYEHAREYAQRSEKHFATLNEPLGRGQCLLLLSWIEHSEGATERSRRLTLEARSEFDKAGYRLGTAQADASLAHVEHRVMNFHNSERGARDALLSFETLQAPRGQAACERLLAMIGVDTDDLDMAELHSDRALKIYQELNDPWGIVEVKLLRCQTYLIRHRRDEARTLLDECANIVIEEAEPRQHYLLTRAWLEAESGDTDRAFDSVEAASDIFGQRLRAGDHTPHLLSRLSRYEWPAHAESRIDAWRALLNDRVRRQQQ